MAKSSSTSTVMAIEADIPVQEVPYDLLRERLLADGQALDLPPNAAPRDILTSGSFPGIVVDDEAARYEGAWTTSTSGPVFIDIGYRHDGYGTSVVPEVKRAIFEAALPAAGEYEVRMTYPPNNNRARNARGGTAPSQVARQLEVVQNTVTHLRGRLLGYGAAAINPYLVFETVHDQVQSRTAGRWSASRSGSGRRDRNCPRHGPLPVPCPDMPPTIQSGPE